MKKVKQDNVIELDGRWCCIKADDVDYFLTAAKEAAMDAASRKRLDQILRGVVWLRHRHVCMPRKDYDRLVLGTDEVIYRDYRALIAIRSEGRSVSKWRERDPQGIAKEVNALLSKKYGKTMEAIEAAVKRARKP